MNYSNKLSNNFVAGILALSSTTLVFAEGLPSYKLRLEGRSGIGSIENYNIPKGMSFTYRDVALNDLRQVATNISKWHDSKNYDGLWFVDNGASKVVYEATDAEMMLSDVKINNQSQLVFSQYDLSATYEIFQFDVKSQAFSSPIEMMPGFRHHTPLTITDDSSILIQSKGGFRGEEGIFLSQGEDLKAVIKNTALSRKSPYIRLSSADVNNQGQVVSHVVFGKTQDYDKNSGGEIRLFNKDNSSALIAEDQSRNPQSPFARLSNPRINDHGVIVFTATLTSGKRAVVVKNGEIIKIITNAPEVGMSKIPDNVTSASINNAGYIVFKAFDLNNKASIYVGDAEANFRRVIGNGDVVETDLGPAKVAAVDDVSHGEVDAISHGIAINNLGDIAFKAQLMTLDGKKRLGLAVFTASAE